MSQATIDLIKDIIYLIPICTLIWKAASMSAKIKENSKDIEDLKNLAKEQNTAILASLEKMNQALSEIRTDVAVLKADRKKSEKE